MTLKSFLDIKIDEFQIGSKYANEINPPINKEEFEKYLPEIRKILDKFKKDKIQEIFK